MNNVIVFIVYLLIGGVIIGSSITQVSKECGHPIKVDVADVGVATLTWPALIAVGAVAKDHFYEEDSCEY